MKTSVVDVKSGWFSKINWTQIVGVVAMAATMFGLDLSAAEQATIVSGIVAVQAAITVILRTWFTKTITPEAAKKV